MRKLMWFTIGFTAACAVSVYLLSGFWLLLIGLFSLSAGVAAWFLKGEKARITAVALLGCVAAFVWCWGFDALYLSHAREQDGQTVRLSITATDYSYDTHYGVAFDGKGMLDGRTYNMRCYLQTKDPIQPGDRISGDFRLRYTADGGEQEATYHQGKGIFLLVYEKENVQITRPDTVSFRHFPAVWRQNILSLIRDIFPEDTFAFAKALLLGDTTDLTYAQDRAFQVSGIRHVVAVSGLHVSILFSVIMVISGYRRLLPSLLGIPLLILFAALAGFTPSVVRACTMYGLMLLALLADREYDPPTALAFAVLVILLVNPIAITAVGFQLSVACTVGILLFEKQLREYVYTVTKTRETAKGKSRKAKLIRFMVGTVSVTLSAMSLTTPLCAAYFGMISVIGILTNLLALWVVSYIFYGIMLACLMGFVWLPAGKLIAWIVSWAIRYVLWISMLFASTPVAAVYTDSVYIVIWLVFAYCLLVLFFLLKRKHPVLTASAIAVGLCICLGLSWVEPLLNTTRVSVIDVGQGQSILLQSGSEHYLVDCGSEASAHAADKTANFLLSQGIFRLDGVILTHYDTDHAGAVLDLLTSVKTDAIYMPDTLDSNGNRTAINQVLDEVNLIQKRSEIQFETGKITLFPAQSASNDNESSMCVLFQSENCDILITGDRSIAGERDLLETVQLPKLELLVAGHHGSKNATGRELLQVTQPEIVAISAGANNNYGHPHQDTLNRLYENCCTVLRTDIQGTIIFRR